MKVCAKGGAFQILFLFAAVLCARAFAPPNVLTFDLPAQASHPVLSHDDKHVAVIVWGDLPHNFGGLVGPSQVHVYEVKTGNLVQSFDYTPGQLDLTFYKYGITWDRQPTALLFSLNGKELIIGFHDGSLKAFDIQTKQETARFAGHRERITSLALGEDRSAKTQPLAAVTYSGALRVWDYAKPTTILHSLTVRPFARVAIQDGAQLMAVSSDSGTLRIWNLASGNEVLRGGLVFYRSQDTLGPVAFAGNGTEVVVATSPNHKPEVVRINLSTGAARSRTLTQLIFGPPVTHGWGYWRAVPAFERMVFSGDASSALAPSATHGIGAASGLVPPAYFCAHMVALGQSGAIGPLHSPDAVSQSYVALGKSGKVGVTVTQEMPTLTRTIRNRVRVWDLP